MKVLILANFGMGLYNFRKELLENLIREEYEVYISLPEDEYVPKLKELGCKFIDTPLNRRGTNPITDLKLIFMYINIIKKVKPDVVLTYTIKPNVYGGLACSVSNTPYITNVTGLGTAVENKGLIQKITLLLYKLGLKKASCVFFQNVSNQQFFIDNKLFNGKRRLIPGSGVNTENHRYQNYPNNAEQIRLLFIGRIMKAKGIEELLEAAQLLKKEYPNVQVDLFGGSEENYNQQLQLLEKQGIIKYHGQQEDVSAFIKNSHAIILPSHHEGLSNVLLEAASTGRPVIASNIPGCRETFDEGISGLGFEVKNIESLVDTITKFIELPYKKKKEMGIAGRRKIEAEFNRDLVVKAYLEEIEKAINKEN